MNEDEHSTNKALIKNLQNEKDRLKEKVHAINKDLQSKQNIQEVQQLLGNIHLQKTSITEFIQYQNQQEDTISALKEKWNCLCKTTNKLKLLQKKI